MVVVSGYNRESSWGVDFIYDLASSFLFGGLKYVFCSTITR
jgi:hypothetical protein